MHDTLVSVVALFGLALGLCVLCFAAISLLALESRERAKKNKENLELQITPDTLFVTAVGYLRDNFYDQGKADTLAAWLRALDVRPDTFADAVKAINKALAILSDEYTVFREVRAEFAEPVCSVKLASHIAYIRIASFRSRQCSKSVYEHVLKLADASAFIVDLRGNGGGLLRQALETFALSPTRAASP